MLPSTPCLQCGRFHEVQAFEGERRSCKESLARHKQRRKKAEALRAQQQEQGGRAAGAGRSRVSEAEREEAQQEEEAQREPTEEQGLGKEEEGQPGSHKAGSSASKAAPPPSQLATEVSATGVRLRKHPRQDGSPRKRGPQQARGPAHKKARTGSPTVDEEAAPARTAIGVSSGGSSRAVSEAPSVHPPAPTLSAPSKPPTPAHSSPCAAKSPTRRGPGNRGSPLLHAGSKPPPSVALPAPQLVVPKPALAAPRPQPHLVQEALKTIGSSAVRQRTVGKPVTAACCFAASGMHVSPLACLAAALSSLLSAAALPAGLCLHAGQSVLPREGGPAAHLRVALPPCPPPQPSTLSHLPSPPPSIPTPPQLPNLDDVPSTEELLTFSQELGLLLDPPMPATALAAGPATALPAAWQLPGCSGAATAVWPAPGTMAAAGGWGPAPAAYGGLAQGYPPGGALPALQLPAWQSPALTSSLAPLQRWSGEPAALAPPPGLQCGLLDASPTPPLPYDWPCGDDDEWLLPLDPLSPSTSLAETFLP